MTQRHMLLHRALVLLLSSVARLCLYEASACCCCLCEASPPPYLPADVPLPTAAVIAYCISCTLTSHMMPCCPLLSLLCARLLWTAMCVMCPPWTQAPQRLVALARAVLQRFSPQQEPQPSSPAGVAVKQPAGDQPGSPSCAEYAAFTPLVVSTIKVCVCAHVHTYAPPPPLRICL